MSSYAMFAKLQGKPCVVVGGGTVAERKIASLLAAQAAVKVISPNCTGQIARWSAEECIRYISRPFEPSDLSGAMIVIAASSDAEVNLQVYRSAEPHQWVNIVDRPDLCTFTVPAVAERGDIRIAISTGGMNPGFAKKLKGVIEQIIGPEYGEHIGFLGQARKRIISLHLPARTQHKLLEHLLDDSFLELTRMGKHRIRDRLAGQLIEEQLNQLRGSSARTHLERSFTAGGGGRS